MATPPLKTELSDTYPSPSNAVMRTGMGKLWETLFGTGGLLGSTGDAADARVAFGLSSASQAEMEAGTEAALRAMSPLRVNQAIAALAPEPDFVLTTPTLLGYGTGAGGTVTQASTKGTSVTLNTPCGRIAMDGGGLSAGALVSFSLNNSLIGASDIILVNISGGVSSWSSYRCWAAARGAGVTEIMLENRSAGSLSEAVLINFVVIKGAVA